MYQCKFLFSRIERIRAVVYEKIPLFTSFLSFFFFFSHCQTLPFSFQLLIFLSRLICKVLFSHDYSVFLSLCDNFLTDIQFHYYLLNPIIRKLITSLLQFVRRKIQESFQMLCKSISLYFMIIAQPLFLVRWRISLFLFFALRCKCCGFVILIIKVGKYNFLSS